MTATEAETGCQLSFVLGSNGTVEESMDWHPACSTECMTDVALSILALIAGGLTLELFGTAWTPASYPDKSNLTMELNDAFEDCQAGNPS